MGLTIAILITTITAGSFVFQPNDAFASKGKLTSLTLIYESTKDPISLLPVDIAVTDKKGNSQGMFTDVTHADEFIVVMLPPDKEHFESKTFFEIIDTSVDPNVTLDVIEIHTSCSQPLEDGDIHPGTNTQLIIKGNYCEEEPKIKKQASTNGGVGTIFHHESIQFTTVSATAQAALDDNCDLVHQSLTVFNCVEAGRFYVNNEDKFLIVDTELDNNADNMIVLFSVVEANVLGNDGLAESPLCLLSGIGTHTSTGYLDDEGLPTGYVDTDNPDLFMPNGKLGFEISCTDLKVDTNYNVNYALIRT